MGMVQSRLGLYDDAIQSFLKQRDKGDDPDNESALASVYEQRHASNEAEEASAARAAVRKSEIELPYLAAAATLKRTRSRR